MVGKNKFIPNVSSPALQKQENLDYAKGLNTFDSNDIVDERELVYITDSRIASLGRYITRQGCDFYSDAAGETLSTQQTSVTGTADQAVALTTWFGAKFAAGSSGALTKVDLRLKNSNSGTGALIVSIYSDVSGSPGVLLAESSVPAASITSSYTYISARFIQAPAVVSATSYWIVLNIQDDGTNDYKWSSTTNATTAKTSINSGVSWSTTAFDFNYKTYISTNSPTKGLYRAYKSDGTAATLMAHGTVLYSVNDASGALTSVKTALSASATDYRFTKAEDIIYYVNGFDAPRKWNFTTDSANGGTSTVSSNIILHKDQIFYQDATNPTRLFFTDKTSFENFTSTNFLYVPSPKTSDPITALTIMNDNLYIFTQSTKWVLYGSDLSSFTLRKAAGVKGTYSQESVALTKNYVYFMSDDGIYRSNGETDELISQKITDKLDQITNRDEVHLQCWNNRLYVFYTVPGGTANSKCLVYNITYGSWESEDQHTYINRSTIFFGDNFEFVQGSSIVGQAFYGELSTNTYNNLGKPLEWELRTRYDNYGNPSAQKRVKRWYTRWVAQEGNYTVFAQFDKDFANQPTTQAYIYMRGSGYLWGDAATIWGAFTWGRTSFITERLGIPGRAQYIQRRYKRFGVNLPVEFLGESIYYMVRRAR